MGIPRAVDLAGVEVFPGVDLDVVDRELGDRSVRPGDPDLRAGPGRAQTVEDGRPGLGVDMTDEQGRADGPGRVPEPNQPTVCGIS